MKTKNPTENSQRRRGLLLPRFVRCIWALGWRNGFWYWKIMKLADRDPNFILRWADRCEADAKEMKDPKFAVCANDWAAKLRKYHSGNVTEDLTDEK